MPAPFDPQALDTTLFGALLDAAGAHGGGKVVLAARGVFDGLAAALMVQKAERLCVIIPCPDAFHRRWHILHEDEQTRDLPQRPRCPACSREAEQVIEVVYVDDWRDGKS